MAYLTLTAAGEYLVDEEDRAGWIHVVPADGTTTIDIQSGDMLKPLEFGNFMLGQITGQKFYDWNLNGLKDEHEPGLANWVMWINGTLVGRRVPEPHPPDRLERVVLRRGPAGGHIRRV